MNIVLITIVNILKIENGKKGWMWCEDADKNGKNRNIVVDGYAKKDQFFSWTFLGWSDARNIIYFCMGAITLLDVNVKNVMWVIE